MPFRGTLPDMRIIVLSVALFSFALSASAQVEGARTVTVVTVNFALGMSDLTPEMSDQLDAAVAAYRRSQPVTVIIGGAAADPGPTPYCCGPIHRRWRQVREYLVASDVRGQDIMVETLRLERRPEHARILITFGPGSNW